MSYLDAAVEAVKDTVAERFAACTTWAPMAFLSLRRRPEGPDPQIPQQVAIDLSRVIRSTTKTVAVLRRILRETQTAQIIVAIEAWVVAAQTKEDAERVGRSSESIVNDPAREEAVVLYVHRDDGHASLWIAPISRAGGRPTLGKWQLHDDVVGGPFTGLFSADDRV